MAVKIQYPGAGAALLSDITQLSRVARLAGAWIPGIAMGPILDEVKARMSEELDYDLEARHQKVFARAFRDDDDAFVPDVLAHSSQVIVSEWVEGRPLSQVIAHGTPAERDQACVLYLEFLLRGPNRARLLHADPHPGNFRITPDGRLGVLDYGAVNRLPEGMPSSLGEIITATLAGDERLSRCCAAPASSDPMSTCPTPRSCTSAAVRGAAPARYVHVHPDWLRSVSATSRNRAASSFLASGASTLLRTTLLIHRVLARCIGCSAIRARSDALAHHRPCPGIDITGSPRRRTEANAL